jgi:microcystin degradation protein MlrC
MATRKKPEGIAALAPAPYNPSVQEITMLDWYAGFVALRTFAHPDHQQSAQEIFDMAEAMLAEREKRI